MDMFNALQSEDFIWPQVRALWREIEDLSLYSKYGLPDAEHLKAWKDSWTQEKKICLVKNYDYLRMSDQTISSYEQSYKELQELFDQYFPSNNKESKLSDLFFGQEHALSSIIHLMNDVKSWRQIDLHSFFKSCSYLSNENESRAKYSMPFLIDKLAEFLADFIIQQRVREKTKFMLRDHHPAVNTYLNQALWSDPELFQSQSVMRHFQKKPHLAIKNTPPPANPQKIVPSWMILAYLKGYYAKNDCILRETKIIRMKLSKNVQHILENYIKEQQKTVVQHFSRVIYALYADKLPQQVLSMVGLDANSSHRGLFAEDMALIQSFYEKWKIFSNFDDGNMKGDKLICHKIRAYLQYYGFNVKLSRSQVIATFCKAHENLVDLGLSAEIFADLKDNGFLSSLSSGAMHSFKVLKKYGPIVLKIGATAALFLAEATNTLEHEDSDDDMLAVDALQGGEAVSKKRKTSIIEEAKDVENMIATHFARYMLCLIEDYLKDPKNQSILPVSEKFPWLENVCGAMQQKHHEYYYTLEEYSLTAATQKPQEIDNEEMLRLLSSGLQVQPQWAQRLLRFFDLRVDSLEKIRQKMKHSGYICLDSQQINWDGFEQWREQAHACWTEHAHKCVSEWERTQLYPLSLPHLSDERPETLIFMQRLKSYLQRESYTKARDVFVRLFQPSLIKQLMHCHPEIADVDNDPFWLDFALAFGDKKLAGTLYSVYIKRYEESFLKSTSSEENLLRKRKSIESYLNTNYEKKDLLKKMQDIFLTALRFDMNVVPNPAMQHALGKWLSADMRYTSLLKVVMHTTAQQFENVLPQFFQIPVPRTPHPGNYFQQQLVHKVLSAWSFIPSRCRDEKKIKALIPYIDSINYYELGFLITCCSDELLQHLIKIGLVAVNKLDTEMSNAIRLNALIEKAYSYGLKNTAQRLTDLKQDLSLEQQGLQQNELSIYASYLSLLSYPKDILTQEQKARHDLSQMKRECLRALLMHTSQQAVQPLAQIIFKVMGDKEYRLSISEYTILIKNLFTSKVLSYQKQKYLAVIFENLSDQELSKVFAACSRKGVSLDYFILNMRHVPKAERGSSEQMDRMFSRLLSLVLRLPEPQKNQELSIEGHILSLKKQVFSSLNLLELLIQRKWLHSLAILSQWHKADLSKEQWLPVMSNKETQDKKTACLKYRQYENYILLLLQSGIFSAQKTPQAQLLYRYWKKVEYAPSLFFIKEIIRKTEKEEEKSSWLKVFLKLSTLFDQKTKRRHALWSYCLSQINSGMAIKIWGMPLEIWLRKKAPTDVIKAYMDSYAIQHGQALVLSQFPLHLQDMTSCSPAFLGRFYYALCNGGASDVIHGYHIRFLRAYLVSHYEKELINPALSVRSHARELLSMLMRFWIQSYSLSSVKKIRQTLKKTRTKPANILSKIEQPPQHLDIGDLRQQNLQSLVDKQLLSPSEGTLYRKPRHQILDSGGCLATLEDCGQEQEESESYAQSDFQQFGLFFSKSEAIHNNRDADKTERKLPYSRTPPPSPS